MERRRAERVPVSDAYFILKEEDSKEILCHVVNLSRLGLALLRPVDKEWCLGDLVHGRLCLGEQCVELSGWIRNVTEQIVGLEYKWDNEAQSALLAKILSPTYIAHSIRKVDACFLSPDVEQAFRGDEFECVIFKPGKHHLQPMVQFFAQGKVIEICGEKIRFVPGSLMRSAGEGGFQILSEFLEISSSDSLHDLCLFFDDLKNICKAWKECPQEILTLVNTYKEKLQQKLQTRSLKKGNRK